MTESWRKLGERRVSAQLCQRGNGAEGMELKQEGVGGTGKVRSMQGDKREAQRGCDIRRWEVKKARRLWQENKG